MTIAETKPLTKHLTDRDLHYYAAVGLNIELNGMSLADAEVMKANIIKNAKRRKNREKIVMIPFYGRDNK